MEWRWTHCRRGRRGTLQTTKAQVCAAPEGLRTREDVARGVRDDVALLLRPARPAPRSSPQPARASRLRSRVIPTGSTTAAFSRISSSPAPRIARVRVGAMGCVGGGGGVTATERMFSSPTSSSSPRPLGPPAVRCWKADAAPTAAGTVACLHTLTGHSDFVQCLAAAPAAAAVVSAGCLGEVFVWNLGGDMRGVAIGEGRGGVVGCV